jgi:hypothetical protein
MKRWILAACLVLISALGVLVPAGAQASTVAGGKLSSGKPVKATISKAGQQVKYTFASTAGANVTFNVTNFDFTGGPGYGGEVGFNFYEPGSSTPYTSSPSFTGNGYYHFTTPVGGTWSVTLVPYRASVGSLTLTFANDVPTQALISGKPVTTTIKFEGQQAGYTFASTAGANVTFNVTNFDFTGGPGYSGEVGFTFYKPGSSTPYILSPSFTGDGHFTFTTPVGGTWSATLVPYEASVGSLTLELT